MLNNKYKSLILVLILVFTLTSVTLASSSAKNVGLGDNFVTITGANAFYGNPGAVNATDDVFTLEIGANANFWNNLLMNDYIDENEKEVLLDQISDDGLLVGVENREGVKLIMGPIGVMADIKQEGLFSFSPDLAEVLLRGNEINQEYNLGDIEASGGAYADGGLNLSLQAPQDLVQEWNLNDLYVGFTYHQLAGTIFQLEGQGSGQLTYGDDLINGAGNFAVKYNKPQDINDLATGSAFDLGAYAKLNDTYSVGFSIMNIGTMVADSGTYKVDYQYGSDGNLQEVSEVPLEEELKWHLPSTVRVGAKMEPNNVIKFLTDYSYTRYYNQQRETNYKDHQISLATELTWPSFIPLRTGVNYSTLKNNLKWSAGLGLDLWILEADVGISDLTGLFNQSKEVEGAITTRIEF